MNYSQSFEEFSSSVGPTDLALYAGIGVVLFVLFKDKLSPVQKMIMDLVNSAKDTVSNMSEPASVVTVKVPMPELPKVGPVKEKEDVFFKLIASWKQTRDLSQKSGCGEATEKLDEIFQYLSPNVCDQEKTQWIRK